MDYLQINELYHHGIKGQKWGVRRFTNEDGSLTPAGEERYGISNEKMKAFTDAYRKRYDDWDGPTDAARNNRKKICSR